jgi:DNA (cytosine-5)-methyltransferase 1
VIVDLFAGGGGASEGIRLALGRDPDVAVNHSAAALAMHAANHPLTRHYREDVFDVNPRRVCGGRDVELLWMSPDCTHFSKAKGTKPRDKGTRSLAWVATRWAAEVRPRVIALENVEEFATWGPLCEQGQPIRERRGETFAEWCGALRALGYTLDWRTLVAADYGAPTTRKRLFLVARCDGEPIAWPEPTHGRGRAHPWRTAAEVIDWSLPCPSIFERARPLAEKTLARIAEGVRRYVLDAARPFLVGHYGSSVWRGVDGPVPTVTAGGGGHVSLVAPTLIQTGYGERDGQTPRVPGLDKPLGTVVAGGAKHALVAALLTKHYGGVIGHEVERPVGAITTQDHHAVTTAFLTKFYGTSTGASVDAPMPTVTATGWHLAEVRALLERFARPGTTRTLFGSRDAATVMIDGATYAIADIGMRMLAPRELFRAQGFPDSYRIDVELDGAPLTKTQRIALAGNSVCPQLAEAVVRANVRAAEEKAA